MLITETWLQQSILDSAIELAGRAVHRHDRTGSRAEEVGLCIYTNNCWCRNARL